MTIQERGQSPAGNVEEKLTPPTTERPRHRRDTFYIVGEGVFGLDDRGRTRIQPPSTDEDLRAFRFSRIGPKADKELDVSVLAKVAAAMTTDASDPAGDSTIPAGFTYLGQFVDHDLTKDVTAVALGDDVTVAELKQGRSPALDLDSLYGRGPRDSVDRQSYDSDGIHLRVGRTVPAGFPPNVPEVLRSFDGYDLPRAGDQVSGTQADKRRPVIPDARNDENLAIAQTHCAFIRFHNRVVDTMASAGVPSFLLFEKAREETVLHYQWMLRHDFLPRIVDKSIVDEVFTRGRRHFEATVGSNGFPDFRLASPTMPVEFSVAAYRLGHSMIRKQYEWNRVFNAKAGIPATLQLLFTFTGVAGNFAPGTDLNDPNVGNLLQLPSNWIADFRRLFTLSELGNEFKLNSNEEFNVARTIDTTMADPLALLPKGTFDGRGTNPPPVELNLAFRNLVRANMIQLATGQQMAQKFGVKALKPAEVLGSGKTTDLTKVLSADEQKDFAAHTPLWFYILREAELNRGLLTGVGGRIVVEVFHRSMENSRHSILRKPFWRPRLGTRPNRFDMVDLLHFAFEGKPELLNPLGKFVPTP